jgi:4-methyl-5(b-hydroxyethyl)-thiazole monophosphate biosynthesis
MKMSKACVFFADGFEEVEALTVVDILRRAGIETKMVSISDSLDLVGRSNIRINADVLFSQMKYDDVDLLVLPGGQPGTTYLGQHEGLKKLLKVFAGKKKKKVAAICAAPTVLGALGILEGRKATCYPGLENQLTGAEVEQGKKVVVDGNVITSRGVGTAVPFALKLAEELEGRETSDRVAGSIVFQH